jgi:cell division protein FtsW
MEVRSKHPVDHVLLVTVFLLIIFGIIMITSIGVPKSIKLSAPQVLYPNCEDSQVNCYLILQKHLIRVFVGFILMIAAFKIPLKIWRTLSLPIFVLSVLALFVVLLIGTDNNTFARSWINFSQGSIQPAEFAKIALILYFARWMEKKSVELQSFQQGFIPFCVISSFVILPVILQPDLGSTLIFTSISVVIYFVAGARIRDLLFGAVVAGLIAAIVVSNVTYLRERFQVFLHQDEACEESYCWQSEQANIAVGSGGFWGKGLTQGIQKSYWLPQASDDFIFAASAEELGFFRIVFVVIAYLVVAYRGYHISLHAPTKFSMLVAAGLTTAIVLQAFLNIAVNIDLFPITGITLPFVSYGGSSLATSLLGVGILLHISQYTTEYAYNAHRRRNRGTHFSKYRRFRRT